MKATNFIGPIILFALWEGITKTHFVNTFFLPSPGAVFLQLVVLIIHGQIIKDLLFTLERVAAAFLLATALGVPLGLFLGSKENLYRSVEFVIDFFRSTPATALFPLFLLLFGVTDISKIAVTTFTTGLIIIFNTAYGVMRAERSRILAARIMGASRAQIFFKILFWESLPQTFIGLRSAISLALVVVVVTEMFIGTNHGLGRAIIDAQITYEIPTMYAAIFLTGLIGYALNFLFLFLEKKILHWCGN